MPLYHIRTASCRLLCNVCFAIYAPCCVHTFGAFVIAHDDEWRTTTTTAKAMNNGIPNTLWLNRLFGGYLIRRKAHRFFNFIGQGRYRRIIFCPNNLSNIRLIQQHIRCCTFRSNESQLESLSYETHKICSCHFSYERRTNEKPTFDFNSVLIIFPICFPSIVQY